jgi:hypothetical protein
MPRLRRDNRAVAGFFEEIPAAVVVMVSLILFFSAVFSGLRVHTQELNSSNFESQAQTFLAELTAYKNLTYENRQGVFDSTRVTTLTTANITYDFHPPFNYMVVIDDTSAYAAKYNLTLQTAPVPTTSAALKVGLVSDSTPVNIWVPDLTFDEYHTATLTVVIWE